MRFDMELTVTLFLIVTLYVIVIIVSEKYIFPLLDKWERAKNRKE